MPISSLPKSNILHTFTSISHLFSVPYVCLFDTSTFLISSSRICSTAKLQSHLHSLIPYFRILVPSLDVFHYTTLHCTTLPYTTLHYTTLHYTALHYTTLHYTTYYTTPHYTTLHYTTPHYTTLHMTHYNSFL
jgi:hypothetical protein